MMLYPKLIPEMRRLFLLALTDRGIVTSEALQKEARQRIGVSHETPTDDRIEECENALIDLYFANHFSDAEIEDHINLARKMERFWVLNRVVNVEGVTSIEIKRVLKSFCEIPEGELYIPPNEAMGTRVALINHFISNQLPFIGVAKNHITIRDIDELCDQCYWSKRRPGRIGGKAAGMLLAYKIILPRLARRDPELEKSVVIPESYYFNSGIFSDFLDHNDLHGFHSQKYKTREAIEEEYRTMAVLFQKADFPPDVVEEFRGFLEKVGEHPLILRSSSLLEDNYGYAFSGKYDSVFIANRGDPERRLRDFIWGLKRVHMSTFGPAPILYRRDHNLLDFDEKMSVLVQKVAGERFGDHFFPLCAGVAYSRNTFRWTPRIRAEDGLVRLVFGLGTRAVNRIVKDYPRMVALSHPLLRPEIGAEQIRKYSQRMVDVLNLSTNQVESVPYLDLLQEIEHPDLSDVVSIIQNDHMAPPRFRGQGIDISRSCVTFENFLTKTPFVGLMKRILKRLEQEYGCPVDIEFAWSRGKLYLLQCRTLALQRDVGRVHVPKEIPPEQLLFTNDRGVPNAVMRNIEFIVYVDPKAYSQLESHDAKLAVGRIVSRLNRLLDGRRYGLFGPGRWGSNDMNLGVRVGYEDINNTLVLVEVAFEEDGVTPEVSHGTHFFNDLVEAHIVPVALYPDRKGVVFNEGFLLGVPNSLLSMLPEFGQFSNVVRVIHIPSCTQGRLLHVFQDEENQQGVAFFSYPEDVREDGGDSGRE
jgi:hypothetical protein